MTGTAVKQTSAFGFEPAASQGRQPIFVQTVIASTQSATNQPQGTTGIRPYIEVRGLSAGAAATITIAGLKTDGVTAVTDTSPNISQATADPDGVFRWCSTKVYGSINASGITASSIVTSLASATLVVYGFVAAKWLVPSDFHAVEELPEFSPPDFRGIFDEDIRMAQLAKKVTWDLKSGVYSDADQFFVYASIANATSPATPASLPSTPTVLHANAAFSVYGASFTLTTQPTAPDMGLQFVIASNALAGTFTIPGTNRNGQAISEVVSVTAGTPNGTFYSQFSYASVGTITVTGFTSTGTLTINGVNAYNPVWNPTDTLATLGGEWYDGTDSKVLSFMACTDFEVTYDVEKELQFVLKGEAQDMQPIGDRSRALITTSDFPAYTQPTDFVDVGWPALFWLDPINGIGQTTQWLDIITFKLVGVTGQKLYMTANGIQVLNRIGRKRRKTTFECEIDYQNVQLESKYRAFQKQIIYVKFQQPFYYLGNSGGAGSFYKYIQFALYPRMVKFALDPKDEKVMAKISGTCEYEPSVGYAFNVSMLNQNNPNYFP